MGKSKQRKKKRKFQDLNFSGLDRHQRQGKTLLPPANKLSTVMSHTSWRDDHAPEMLWALLLAETWPREDYLECFRLVSKWYRAKFPPPPDDPEGAEDPKTEPKPEKRAKGAPEFQMPNMESELDHTSLAALSDEHFAEFVRIPLTHPLGYAALRPLLLLDSLPGIERWRKVLDVEPTDQDWHTLQLAVAQSLDHQSQKSTDVRWLKYVLKIILHKMVFMRHLEEIAKEALEYPNRGDQRAVRASIRASELNLQRNPPSPWIEKYWQEVFEKTPCIDPSSKKDYIQDGDEVEPLEHEDVMSARFHVIRQFMAMVTTTRADARLDGAFGFALFAISLLEEVGGPLMSRTITSRMALRTLAEVVITFSYLTNKNDRKLWATYRSHGSGQAKLAFLKLEEVTGDLPQYVDQAALHAIANEDIWQEFQNIDLGQWADKSVRDLAIQGGTKDIYDKYYDWTSTYSHGMWGGVRDSNFVSCFNPLHRLHRIPRTYHRLLPSMITDAVTLVNRTFDLLEAAYPSMEKIPRLKVNEPARAAAPPAEAWQGMEVVPVPEPQPAAMPPDSGIEAADSPDTTKSTPTEGN